MTGKQIIIDCVDVSDCAYLRLLDNGVYKCISGAQQCLKYRVCECNHDCYFKQLKRKEQELEKICKAFDIEYVIDKETGSLIGRCNKLNKKEQECEEWKSYYELYRIETDRIKKVHAVINSNPKYGIEFTKNGIIVKDERISYLEIHEQIKLIIDEQAKEIDMLTAENEELQKTIAEIKEIAGSFYNACQKFEPEKSKNCINCTYCNYNEILQKLART